MQRTLVQFIVEYPRLTSLVSGVHEVTGYAKLPPTDSVLYLPAGHGTFGIFRDMAVWLEYSRALAPSPDEVRLMVVPLNDVRQYFGWQIGRTGKVEIMPAQNTMHALVYVSYNEGDDQQIMLEVLDVVMNHAVHVNPIEVTPAALQVVGEGYIS